MLSQVHSFVLQGIDPMICEVEVDVADRGLAKTMIVGLPDAAVKEAIERVRSAVSNSGYPFPMSRLLVNLAPADIRKEGPTFDLPIALGLLLAERVIESDDLVYSYIRQSFKSLSIVKNLQIHIVVR
jgi:magnesium chelatase family protein